MRKLRCILHLLVVLLRLSAESARHDTTLSESIGLLNRTRSLACGHDADSLGGRGAKVYIHAVIDNFSRRILAWQANENYDTSTASKLLIEAAKGLEGVSTGARVRLWLFIVCLK